MKSLKLALMMLGGLVLMALVVIVGSSLMQSTSDWALTHTPSQEAQIWWQVRLFGVTREESEITMNLADAEATVTDSHARMMLAQAEKERADFLIAEAQKEKQAKAISDMSNLAVGIGLVGLMGLSLFALIKKVTHG